MPQLSQRILLQSSLSGGPQGSTPTGLREETTRPRRTEGEKGQAGAVRHVPQKVSLHQDEKVQSLSKGHLLQRGMPKGGLGKASRSVQKGNVRTAPKNGGWALDVGSAGGVFLPQFSLGCVLSSGGVLGLGRYDLELGPLVTRRCKIANNSNKARKVDARKPRQCRAGSEISHRQNHGEPNRNTTTHGGRGAAVTIYFTKTELCYYYYYYYHATSSNLDLPHLL
mmetsp:Transcript_25660/g.60307  ORF Transcript_25660/g.60307 Transcript_25660/m.60307 type:complete len:224 (-) Transcript_25660:1315-1986(-)